MPRTPRKKSESGIYHIVIRGVNKQQIFYDSYDFEKFFAILSECKSISGFEIYSYCLMSNHVHILIKENTEPIGTVMKRICTRYAMWFNKKHNRTGHLFQDRFHSEPVDNDIYFLAVFNYIHNNPVKAGICESSAAYPYSSAGIYENKKTDGLIDIDFVYELCSINQKNNSNIEEIVCFQEFEEKQLNDKRAMEIICVLTKENEPCNLSSWTKEELKTIIPTLRKEGLSIRQLSRLTGVPIGLIRRFK